MEERDKPWLSSLTYFGFLLNAWMQEGDHGVTFDDVYTGLDDGTLWEVLGQRLPDADLSMMTSTAQGKPVIAALREASLGMRQREERKYGVASSGLALLMAYVLEAIQAGHWVHTSTTASPPPSAN